MASDTCCVGVAMWVCSTGVGIQGSQVRPERQEVHPRSHREAEKLEQNIFTVVFHNLKQMLKIILNERSMSVTLLCLISCFSLSQG